MGVDLKRARRIYEKLMRISPRLADINSDANSEIDGYMPLRCEILETGRDFRRIALGHYWKLPCGNRIPDPDIELAVFLDWQLAEAMTYQDACTYTDAYPVMGEPPDFTAHGHINSVLETWLETLAEQGHLLMPSVSNGDRSTSVHFRPVAFDG
jgi:uncharacterized protein YqiB (DUF1249 family)